MNNILLKVAELKISNDYCGRFVTKVSGVNSNYFTIIDKDLYLIQEPPVGVYSITISIEDPANRFTPKTQTYTLTVTQCTHLTTQPPPTTTNTTTTGTTTTGTTTTGTTTTGTTTTGTTTTGTTTTNTTTTGTTTTGTTTTVAPTTTGTPTTTTSGGGGGGGGEGTTTTTTTNPYGGYNPGDPPVNGGVGGCEAINLCDMGGNTCCPCGWSLDICGCVPPNCECVPDDDLNNPNFVPLCD